MAFVNWKVEILYRDTDVEYGCRRAKDQEDAKLIAEKLDGEIDQEQFYTRIAVEHLDDAFYAWIQQVEAEAKRVLARDNVEWMVGDWRDMEPSYKEGMSPAEYVQEQVENID